MRRKLFNLSGAASAVLFAAVVALWVRSYGRLDTYGWGTGNDRASMSSYAGGAFYNHAVASRGAKFARPTGYQTATAPSGVILPANQSFAGFRRGAIGLGPLVVTGYRVPFWALAVLAATLPAAWAWAWTRKRRTVRPGHCNSCGYDLRATPDRCPECGTPAAKAAS